MSGVNLQAIYNRLRSVPAYHPMSANTYADWSMEAGDMVTVSRNGIAYKSPVGSSTVKWTGKQQIQIQSEGSRERDPISRVSARKYATGGGGTSGIRANQSLYYEMIDKDRELRGVISATAEGLTVDYTKRISAKGIELEGKISATAERLVVDYTKKIDDKGVEMEGKIEASAERLELSISNLDDKLSARINVTDKTASMSVGRVKFSNTAHYANKASFPAVGRSDTLYYADDTRKAYIYIPEAHFYAPAAVDEYGNANYIKAGEIVIAINENGDTEAKLDADVIYAGRNTKQTLAGLELPDWMDTTEGLVAEKATIVDLKAVDARVETLEADTITTKNMESRDVMFRNFNAHAGEFTDDLSVLGDLSVVGTVQSNGYDLNVADAEVSGNTLTITKVDGTTINFSKATTLSVEYGGDNTGDTATFTVTASPQGNTATGTFKVKQSKTAAYVTDPNGTIRARIDNPQYGNGWNAAYWKVSLPTASSTANSFSIGTPPATVDGAASTETYTMSNPMNNVAVVKNSAGTIVARLEHNQYTAGHNDGYTAGGSTAKVNTVYKIDALPEGKSAIGLSAADSYYQITPAYVNKSGVSVATDNITYIKTPAASTEVTVDNWQRSNFGQDTKKRASKTLSIPVSVNVNGVTYSNTFTTGSMSLEKYDSTYVNVYMGSTIIARLALFDD